VELSEVFWQRAKLGLLTDEEIELAAHTLRESNAIDVQSKLIYALGRAGAMKYQSLLESFLTPDTDGAVVWAALTVLVTDWAMSSPTINKTVLEYIEGADWDENAFLRELAVSLAGSIARNTGDEEMMHALLRMARGEITVGPSKRDLQEWGDDRDHWDKERLTSQQLAIDNLAYALGYSHREISEKHSEVGYQQRKWEQAIMSKASTLLQRNR
jgi:hypothetical protein